MFFINKENENFFNDKIGQAKRIDCYIKSLIYVLSNNDITMKYFNEIYNINTNEINLNIFNKPWQTNESLNICRLAFNLYGDLNSDNVEEGASYLYTVTSIFKNININVGLEAIKIRFFSNYVDIPK